MPAFPSELPASIVVTRERVQAFTRSEFSLKVKRQAHTGLAWRISIKLQTAIAAEAAVMIAFLDSLAGQTDSFTLDLTPYCPGITTGTKTFLLESPDVSWEVGYGCTWDFQFSAVELT